MKATVRFHRRILLAVFFLPCFVATLHAGGAPEENRLEKGRVKAYVILPASSGPVTNEQFLDQFYLVPYLSSFAWSGFRVNDGGVKLEQEGGLRITLRKPFLTENLGENTLYGYDLETDYHGSGIPSSGMTFSFSFKHRDIGRNKDAIIQPAAWALMKGINNSGKTAGFIRLESLTYEGGGRFRAKVQLR
ncbi:MAG TPA: hypothetical protein VMX75_10655 [Spirochaetia bacterium]|nr:hypothetical protein [Spirochaetia bacterium]